MQQSLAGHSQAHASADGTRYKVLGAISFSHFLNDMIQSLIIAIYPLLKGEFDLSFAQIGMISLTYQICASVLQPLVGTYTDRHPQPHSLSAGMPRSSLPPPWWVPDRPFFTPSPRASHASRRAAASGWPSRYFRSGAAQAAPRAPCSRRGSSFPTAARACPGSRWPRFSRS